MSVVLSICLLFSFFFFISFLSVLSFLSFLSMSDVFFSSSFFPSIEDAISLASFESKKETSMSFLFVSLFAFIENNVEFVDLMSSFMSCSDASSNISFFHNLTRFFIGLSYLIVSLGSNTQVTSSKSSCTSIRCLPARNNCTKDHASEL